VPPYTARVRVEGAVRREAIYEVREGEDVRDAIRFAGGFHADAVVRRVQIDRVQAPVNRRPGVDRVLVDVDVARLQDGATELALLRDGDAVRVFAVSDERRHRVSVVGEVHRPGLHEWTQGLTLWDLIERAEGLVERAYTSRAHIYRLVEEDGSRRLVRTALLADSTGAAVQDVLLADRDSVVIFSREQLRSPQYVSIDGFVKKPGTYELADGMTVRDLVLSAGGFITGAYVDEAELARMPPGLERTGRTARILRVPIGDGQTKSAEEAGREEAAGQRWSSFPDWVPGAGEFVLDPGDRVFIRKAPNYELPRMVTITGQVMMPGTYVLESRSEKLIDLLDRAGGLTPEAYRRGLRLVRDSALLATDLPQAIRQPQSRYNLVLQPGDSLHVPEYDPTVLVTGAVNFESRVLWEAGRNLQYYVNRAGGYTDVADSKRLTVTYQDGERAGVERKLLFRRRPTPEPGSTIFVPSKPEHQQGGVNWGEVIVRTSTLVTTFATLLIAWNQIR